MSEKSNNRILLVDDDPNILSAFRRQLGRRFSIETAPGGQEGLALLRTQGPFAVVVSDLRMPGLDGIRFLGFVRKISPSTVRLMLTGQADLEAAVEAVNEGNIFRFLLKPCPTPILTKALEDSLAQYRLLTAERELLEKTLSGSIRVFSEILSMVNPAAFSRAARIKRYVKAIAATLNLPKAWQYELAAMFSQIGCVTLPPELLQKAYTGQNLTETEQVLFDKHPQVGGKLLSYIPRLESIARMVEDQQKPFHAFPSNQRDARDPVALGAQLLKLLLDFDKLTAGGLPPAAAAAQLSENAGQYNPTLLRALQNVSGKDAEEEEKRTLRVDQLHVGMILRQDVTATNGLLLVASGQEITPPVLERLRNFKHTIGVLEPISVRVPKHQKQEEDQRAGKETVKEPEG